MRNRRVVSHNCGQLKMYNESAGDLIDVYYDGESWTAGDNPYERNSQQLWDISFCPYCGRDLKAVIAAHHP